MSIPATLFFHSPPLNTAVFTSQLPLHSNSNIRLPVFTSHSSRRQRYRTQFVAFANGNGNRGGGQKEEVEEDVQKKPVSDGQRRAAVELGGRLFRWRDLLEPDPENIVAVGLTGLLTLASVQALWQLFLISIAILLGALKYSFIAALLLFIVITLL